MALAFGSVGDLIAVCVLVADLSKALADTGGSAQEYRRVTDELHHLDRALYQVAWLISYCKSRPKPKPKPRSLCQVAPSMIIACRKTVEGFLKRIKEYHPSLGANSSSGNWFVDSWKKVQWSCMEGTELNTFRTELSARITALDMVLNAANIELQLHMNNDVNDHFAKVYRDLKKLMQTIKDSHRRKKNKKKSQPLKTGKAKLQQDSEKNKKPVSATTVDKHRPRQERQNQNDMLKTTKTRKKKGLKKAKKSQAAIDVSNQSRAGNRAKSKTA